MRLTVIIVSYNVKHYIEQCLDSLYRALHGIEAEIYVVDNHSKDNSVEYLQQRFADVKFIACNHNLGFARANNLAISRTESEYILLLNPDTIVGENVIKKSIAFMDSHDDAGGLGVQMLKCNGENALESRRGLPTPVTAFYKMCGLCAKYPENKKFGKYYMGYLPWDEPGQIEVISGAYCFLRRAAIEKAGALDEDFFMYGEDIDLSYRILKKGYTNWYLPVKILHYKGESTQKSSFRYVHVFYDAMLIFFKKHYGNVASWISIPIKLAIYFKAACALLGMSFNRIHKGLGFSHNDNKNVEYLFLVSDKTKDLCRDLAHKKGLKFKIQECNETSHPKGHLALMHKINKKICTYVVYDVGAFKYETILNIFSQCPHQNIQMGTFNANSRTIITNQEILK